MDIKNNITFLNVGDDEKDTLIERAKKRLNATEKAITTFMNLDDLDNNTEEYGTFYEYPLSVDFVEQDGKQAAYIRYQISYGGPSDEIRIYPGDNRTIEYVFLDWFIGIGIDITGEDWAEWLADYYEELYIEQ